MQTVQAIIVQSLYPKTYLGTQDKIIVIYFVATWNLNPFIHSVDSILKSAQYD